VPQVEKECIEMKQTRRFSALLLAMVMLTCLLSGCQKKEPPIAADAVAEAIFELILKDDASSAVELFGYADEAEARKDMGLGDEGLYDAMADEVVSQFSSMGIPTTDEDAQTFVNAFLTMFKNVDMTAVVKESDEKAGTAVVTCTISTFDPNALSDAMNQVLADIMSDEELLSGGDETALYSAILNKISEAIAGLTPSGETEDFDVDFELQTIEINGKDREAWLPKDVNGFGEAIGSTAIGG